MNCRYMLKAGAIFLGEHALVCAGALGDGRSCYDKTIWAMGYTDRLWKRFK